MKRLTVFGLFLLTVAFGFSEAKALVNGGFETGNLSGWTLENGTGSAVTEWPAVPNNAVPDVDPRIYGPVEGSYFAQLTANLGGVWVTLSQSLLLAAGETVGGWAAFDAGDELPFNDDAQVRIYDTSTDALLWSKDIGDPVDGVGDFGSSPWEEWSWTAGASGSYTVEFGVRNFGDALGESIALFDAVQTSAVPEPSTMVLLGIGLLGLAARRRMRLAK